MMKRVLHVLALMAILVVCPGPLPEGRAEEVIVLTGQTWYPFLSEELEHYGFMGQVVTEAFALAGVRVIWKFRPPRRALEEARMGRFDGTAVWSSKTPERLADFYFSDPVCEGPFVFFHLKRYPFDWETTEDLVGHRIGAKLGQEYTPEFNKAEAERRIYVERMSTEEENFHKLLAGRIDIFCVNRDAGIAVLQKEFSPAQIDQITYHPHPIRTSCYAVLLSRRVKGNELMLERFNKGLAELKRSGKYDQYYEAHRQGKYLKR